MQRLRLLVVEGDAEVRRAMSTVLRARYGEDQVQAVATLAEAVPARVSGSDLVLTEWHLPDACGAEVLETLRARGAGAIVVVTAANSGAVATEAVLCGATDYIVRHGDYLVTLPLVVEKNLALDKLRRERDALHRQLKEQNETLEHLLRSLEEAASTDALTGLYNRRHFARLIEQMYANSVRTGTDLACVMLDMDHFKPLNDTQGHQAGDRALVTAARVMEQNLRRMDAAARYGGDEFVLLLPGTHAEEALGVARRIQHAYVEQMRLLGVADVPVGMSFGVATLHRDQPVSADHLVALADRALYEAKRRRVQQTAPIARAAG